MNVREKLVELLKSVLPNFRNNMAYWGEKPIYEFADCLLANGVTVQEWISVKDKLPPYNRNVLVYRPNMAMKILVDTYDGYYGDDDDEWYEGWALYGGDTHGNPVITHWAYLPQPPKGE